MGEGTERAKWHEEEAVWEVEGGREMLSPLTARQKSSKEALSAIDPLSQAWDTSAAGGWVWP